MAADFIGQYYVPDSAASKLAVLIAYMAVDKCK